VPVPRAGGRFASLRQCAGITSYSLDSTLVAHVAQGELPLAFPMAEHLGLDYGSKPRERWIEDTIGVVPWGSRHSVGRWLGRHGGLRRNQRGGG
jgi:hypothetical protein